MSAPDQTEHAALADGTVLRELTLRQLADLRWDAERGVAVWASAGRSHGLLRIAARHLDEKVLEPGKTELDEADLSAVRTVVNGVARLTS